MIPPPDAAPQITLSYKGEHTFRIDWPPVEGAWGYKVRWGQTPGGPYCGVPDFPRGVWDRKGETFAEFKTDKAVNVYCVVTAYNTPDLEGAYSNEVHVVLPQPEE